MTPDDFRRRRLALGLTQDALAALFGITARQLRQLETGKRPDGKPVRTDRPVYALAFEALEARQRTRAAI